MSAAFGAQSSGKDVTDAKTGRAGWELLSKCFVRVQSHWRSIRIPIRHSANRSRALSVANVSGQRIAGQQVDAESDRGGARHPNRLLNGTRGEVEPLSFAVTQGGQAYPVQDPSFILIEVEDNSCRSAIEEVQPTLPAFSTERETTNAMAGQARQSSFTIGERKKNQIDQPFTNAGHVTTQTEQTLAVLAEGRQSDCEGAAIGPEELVAFVGNTFFDMVARRIAMEKYS
jgi:hypothetical protein